MIPIVISNGEPYIWNPKDWYKLRTEHRIIGSFEGAISDNDPTQSHLPFKLMKVETQFLIKNGIGRTVEAPQRFQSVESPVPHETYEALRNERICKQLETFKIRKRASLETLIDKIIEGKRRKGRIIPDREAIIQDELNKVRNLPSEVVQRDYKDPWLEDAEYIPCTFKMPSNYFERLMLQVYEDFYSRKYFLTSGVKFGGQFLAYPGDPIKYHAEFIVVCEDPERPVSEPLRRAQERLAHGVRKTLLIARLDSKTGNLTYSQGRPFA